jgi:hypothetical protein
MAACNPLKDASSALPPQERIPRQFFVREKMKATEFFSFFYDKYK